MISDIFFFVCLFVLALALDKIKHTQKYRIGGTMQKKSYSMNFEGIILQIFEGRVVLKEKF